MTSQSNLILYLVGYAVICIGLGVGAHLIGVPPIWIGVGLLVMIGIGIVSAVKKTQSKAVPEDSGG